MTNNYTKRCSMSLILKEMQSKAMIRYSYTTTGMSKIKRLIIPNGDEVVK